MTGGKVHATDATNASRTLLYDIHRGVWDEDLCARLGVPRAMLPEVRDSAGDFGATTPNLFGRALPFAASLAINKPRPWVRPALRQA